MNFLFKNKSVKPNSVNFDENTPLPGFLKTEPSFNMDYPLPEQEPVTKETSQFSKPLNTPSPTFPPSYTTERKGPLTIHLSHSGMLGILFALLLLGVLFFMAGFLSGMMTTEYAATRSSVSSPLKKPSEAIIDSQGDDNV